MNVDSFVILAHSEPTVRELQQALDAQDMLARLVLNGGDPAEVASDDPPQHLWSGRLGHVEVEFRLGTIEPSRLPGPAKDQPDVQAWPLAIWATNSAGDPETVAAGAMAIYAWAVATGGVGYHWERGVVLDMTSLGSLADFIIAGALNLDSEYEARYPEAHSVRDLPSGEAGEIRVRVL